MRTGVERQAAPYAEVASDAARCVPLRRNRARGAARRCPTGGHGCCDTVSGFCQLAVLPYDDDEPAGITEPPLRVDVPLAIRRQLGHPPVVVAFWFDCMRLAAMPPARPTIHGDPG